MTGNFSQSNRNRIELAALDEEMKALRANFWVDAYSTSCKLRHVTASGSGSESTISGEEMHRLCRSRAFGKFTDFVTPDTTAGLGRRKYGQTLMTIWGQKWTEGIDFGC